MSHVRLMPFPEASVENPYINLLYQHLRQHGVEVLSNSDFWSRSVAKRPNLVPDYVHYHWPGRRYTSRVAVLSPLRAKLFFNKLQAMRQAGAQLIWTMHNEYPHERAWSAFDRRARKRMVERSDIILVNFASAAEILAQDYGRVERVYHIPHGSYRGYYPEDHSREQARERLGLADDAFVFLAFGDLRAYKNFDEVVKAFRRIEQPNARLLIAGRAKTRRVKADLLRHVSGDSRIRLDAREIPDEEVQDYFRSADVMVINRRAFSSGSAVLALDFSLPIIGWRMHHLAEIATGHSLVAIEKEGVDGLVSAMQRALTVDLEASRRDAKTASLRLDWSPIAVRLANILRDQLKDGRR